MTDDQFFRGLLAALKLQGVGFIDTRRDVQHERFSAVVSELARLREEGRPGADALPNHFVPSPFTGRFRELDDALLRLQRGLLGARNPFYPGVELNMTSELAERLLKHFPDPERSIFDQLARTYRNTDLDVARQVG